MKRRKSSAYESSFTFFKKPPHWAKHPICVLMQLRLKGRFLIACKPFLGMGPQEVLWLLLFSWHRPVERIVKISKIRLNGKFHCRSVNWKLDSQGNISSFGKRKNLILQTCYFSPTFQWPNQSSHRVTTVTKWKIWTLSTNTQYITVGKMVWMPDSHSHAFFFRLSKTMKISHFARQWNSTFGSLFIKRHLHTTWYLHETKAKQKLR